MLLAVVCALIIGLSLGVLGSGGSILTIPVLVLILGRPEKLALAEGLAIVGSVSLIGSLPYAFRKEIDWKSVLFFGIPGMVGACVGGCSSYFINGAVQLTLFALVLFAASGFMLFGPTSFERIAAGNSSNMITLFKGFLVGCMTGLLGIGGGFLIVPSLIILCGLSMSVAVGSSLIIISMNSLIGFFEQWMMLNGAHMHVSWSIIGMISSLSIVGCVVGSFFSKRVPQIRLRQLLGVAIFVMGVGILIMQRI